MSKETNLTVPLPTVALEKLRAKARKNGRSAGREGAAIIMSEINNKSAK